MHDRRQRSKAPQIDADHEQQLALFELGGDVSRLRMMREQLRTVGAAAALTRDALRSDWRQWETWCRGVGRRALPALEDTVELYVCACAGEMQHALSTIERRLWAISRGHRESGYESPVGAAVRAVMQGLARERGREQKRKDALTIPELRQMVKTLDARTFAGARDIAILLLGFSTGLRASELSGLELSDVRVGRDRADVRVRRSKTDQQGRGRSIAVLRGRGQLDAVGALERWVRLRGKDAGSFFNVSAQWPRLVVQGSAKKCGLDPSRFGAHSLRAGMMTTLDAAGETLSRIMQRSGHRSIQVAMRYVRHRDGAVAIDPLAARQHRAG